MTALLEWGTDLGLDDDAAALGVAAHRALAIAPQVSAAGSSSATEPAASIDALRAVPRP